MLMQVQLPASSHLGGRPPSGSPLPVLPVAKRLPPTPEPTLPVPAPAPPAPLTLSPPPPALQPPPAPSRRAHSHALRRIEGMIKATARAFRGSSHSRLPLNVDFAPVLGQLG